MKVAVVGAGITGLALTHYLAEEGIESVTFEASDEPGGVIQSRQVDGHTLEVGPQRMRKTPGVAELAAAGGVEDAFVEANEEHLFVYTGGKLREVPFSKREFFRTDLLSWPGKVRLLAEPLTRSGQPTETAEELFVRKFGREAYERFIGPLYGGIYGSDPAEMPAAYALEGLLEREQKHGNFLQAFRERVGQGQRSPPVTLEGGNQQLANAVADSYSNRIELETPVTNIDPLAESSDRTVAVATDGSGDGAHGYRVETPSGSHEVDHVIVTTPAAVTGDLLSDIADGTGGLRELRYNQLALVFLESDCDREGFGYQVGYDEDLRTLGVSWNDGMFDRENLYTAFLGGMHDPEILEADDETLGAIASDEFETVMGSSASVVDVAQLDVGFPAWDQTWWNLEDVETPAGITLATNYTARMGIPSRVREAREIATELAES